MKLITLLLLSFSLLGCSQLPKVQAWEKANLAKAEMRFSNDKLANKMSEQVYASKEASSGTGSVGGGGCGCN